MSAAGGGGSGEAMQGGTANTNKQLRILKGHNQKLDVSPETIFQAVLLAEDQHRFI